jgi:hypothetical protein
VGRAIYYVVLHQGEWKVKHNDNHFGPYSNQKTAFRVAIDTAYRVGQRGQDAEVKIKGVNKRFRTEWTYGHDPYPPPG